MGCPGALDIPSLLTLFLCFVSLVFVTVKPVLGWILRVSGETGKSQGVCGAFCILQETQGPCAAESGRSWKSSSIFSFPSSWGDRVSRHCQGPPGMMMTRRVGMGCNTVRGQRHGCAILGMSLHLSELPFPYLNNWDHPRSRCALLMASVDYDHLLVGPGARGGLMSAWEMEAERGLGWG